MASGPLGGSWVAGSRAERVSWPQGSALTLPGAPRGAGAPGGSKTGFLGNSQKPAYYTPLSSKYQWILGLNLRSGLLCRCLSKLLSFS